MKRLQVRDRTAIARRRSPRLWSLLSIFLIPGLFSMDAIAGWKIKFDGSGSNPVIADGVLYVGSADGAIYALDPGTGSTQWRFQTGQDLASGAEIISVRPGGNTADQMTAGSDAAKQQKAQGIRRVDMTPAVAGGLVLVGSGDHSFYAIDATTGRQKWSYPAGFGMASNNNTSFPAPAPVVEDGSVYFVTQEGLHALDLFSGERKWLFETLREIPVEKLMKRTPSEPVLGDGVIYLSAWPFLGKGAPRNSFLYAVLPEAGTTSWVTPFDGTNITAPVSAKGAVAVAVGPSLYAVDAANGAFRWKLGEGKLLGTPRLLVVRNMIYFSTDRNLLAAELDTGRQTWSVSADRIEGDLRADEQNLYMITWEQSAFRSRSTLRALALTTGQEVWSQVMSGPLNTLLIHGRVVYAGGGRELHALDKATGRKMWTFKGAGALSPPLISGDRVFMSSPTIEYLGSSRVDQGYLYAIDANTGKP